jgi:uncharacterized protein (DUF2345 family)
MSTENLRVIIAANRDVPDQLPSPVQNCRNDLREFNEQFHLVSRVNQPLANAHYRITSSAGEVFEGVTDAQGYTERIKTHDAVDLVIEIDRVDGANTVIE